MPKLNVKYFLITNHKQLANSVCKLHLIIIVQFTFICSLSIITQCSLIYIMTYLFGDLLRSSEVVIDVSVVIAVVSSDCSVVVTVALPDDSVRVSFDAPVVVVASSLLLFLSAGGL